MTAALLEHVFYWVGLAYLVLVCALFSVLAVALTIDRLRPPRRRGVRL